MKVALLQENLNKGISFASRFIKPNPQLKILSNIKLEAGKGQLLFSATNLETGINFKIGAKIIKEGAITVPAKIIQELINLLPKDKVELESEMGKLKIKCQGYKATVNGIEAAEFPKIPTLGQKNKAFILKKDAFLETVSQVVFAVASDETRPVLTSVLIRKREKDFFVVATDGYRLSLKKTNFLTVKDKAGFKEVLIGGRILAEVARLFEDTEEEVSFLPLDKENQAIFKGKNWEVVTRLIDGEFPPFEKIIPEENETRMELETEELLQAVKTAAVFARDASNIIRWELKKKDGQGVLLVSANAPQLGENLIKLTGRFKGKPGKIAFNSRFLLDYLSSVKEKEIVFEMSDSTSPGVFTLQKDKSFKHIVMPVRVQE